MAADVEGWRQADVGDGVDVFLGEVVADLGDGAGGLFAVWLETLPPSPVTVHRVRLSAAATRLEEVSPALGGVGDPAGCAVDGHGSGGAVEGRHGSGGAVDPRRLDGERGADAVLVAAGRPEIPAQRATVPRRAGRGYLGGGHEYAVVDRKPRRSRSPELPTGRSATVD
jgi:hypothetical protein